MSQTLEEIASQPRLWRRALDADASPRALITRYRGLRH